MMMYSEKKKGIYVAIKDYEDESIGGISNYEVGRLSVTSAKTSDSFDKPGSDRQCCVVLKQQNKNIKACKTKFQLYVYFTEIDLLIRTTTITLVDTNQRANIMGIFAFFLSINHTLFPNVIGYTEKMKCGWQRAYNKCGYKYNPMFTPERLPPNSSLGHKRVQPMTVKTEPKKIRYSAVDYDD